MHQTSEHPEFMKTIKEIRDAEEAYDCLIASSKEKADKTMREARERIAGERMKAEEETVAFKNDSLHRGSKEIETEVEKILAQAREEGAKASNRKPDSQTVSKLVKGFVGSL